MKHTLILFFSLLVFGSSCRNESDNVSGQAVDQELATTVSHTNRLEGAWKLVRGEYTRPDGTTIEEEGGGYHLRLFSPSHFAYVMNHEMGEFGGAAAGTYTVNGNEFTETHMYEADSELSGASASFNFRISGDTLHVEGPTKVMDSSGNNLMGRLGRMKEVRVRVR